MNNTIFEPTDKSIAEKQLMEELERCERSGENQGYIDIEESKARLGL